MSITPSHQNSYYLKQLRLWLKSKYVRLSWTIKYWEWLYIYYFEESKPRLSKTTMVKLRLFRHQIARGSPLALVEEIKAPIGSTLSNQNTLRPQGKEVSGRSSGIAKAMENPDHQGMIYVNPSSQKGLLWHLNQLFWQFIHLTLYEILVNSFDLRKLSKK